MKRILATFASNFEANVGRIRIILDYHKNVKSSIHQIPCGEYKHLLTAFLRKNMFFIIITLKEIHTT